MRVDVTAAAAATPNAGACLVTLTPLAAAGNYVPGLWSSLPAYPYLAACPTSSGAPVTSTSGDAGLTRAILAAVNSAVYGTPVAGAGVTSADFASAAGRVVFNRTSNGSTVVLFFAVTSVRSKGPH